MIHGCNTCSFLRMAKRLLHPQIIFGSINVVNVVLSCSIQLEADYLERRFNLIIDASLKSGAMRIVDGASHVHGIQPSNCGNWCAKS